jgi:hypothetical protein
VVGWLESNYLFFNLSLLFCRILGKPQKSFGDELRINRVHLTAVQNHLKDLRAEDSAEGDTKTLSQLRNMHQQLGIKVREDEDKKKKLESRYLFVHFDCPVLHSNVV